MMSGINFGCVAEQYDRYLAGYPDGLMHLLDDHEIAKEGDVVVDLGTGPGTLAFGMARRGCDVVGVDASREMISLAQRKGLFQASSIRFLCSRAEQLCLKHEAFDCAVAWQSWHLFDQPQASKEAFRVLKERGKLLISQCEWKIISGGIAEYTDQIIQKFHNEFKYSGRSAMYPEWLIPLENCNFEILDHHYFDIELRFSSLEWRRRILASAAGVASLGWQRAQKMDALLAQELLNAFNNAELSVPHRCCSIVARKK